MNIMRKLCSRVYLPFTIMLVLNVIFLILALVIDQPEQIIRGFLRIIQSRSILVTDYVALGGIGAALLNVSIVGLSTVIMLIRLNVMPTGANIMALWLSIGFAFFGKNVFNMIPLTFGVWLFAKYCKSSFSRYYLSALLVATLSPTISEIAFMGIFSRPIEITAGIFIGFIVGFIFSPISADSMKVHSGFNLYNMGFAGGLVATMLVTLYKSIGIEFTPSAYWSSGNNVFFGVLLYSISLALLMTGIFSTPFLGKNTLKETMRCFLKIHNHSGRLVTDLYRLYGNSTYINMAALCAFSTTVVLLLGADLNGPAIAGILTITGFGSLGKHLRNVVPVVMGAIISAFVNKWDPAAPANIIAILFSTGLAPIAGRFGLRWGIIAGFLHVNVALYIGDLNGGLNLYNNGFAATFVAIFLLPVITIFKRDEYFKKEKYK